MNGRSEFHPFRLYFTTTVYTCIAWWSILNSKLRLLQYSHYAPKPRRNEEPSPKRACASTRAFDARVCVQQPAAQACARTTNDDEDAAEEVRLTESLKARKEKEFNMPEEKRSLFAPSARRGGDGAVEAER